MLAVSNLCVTFPGNIRAVRDASFAVAPGGFTALVGESGCGKSVSAMSVTRLPPTHTAVVSGTALFQGRDLLTLPPSELRRLRGGGGISYVFQDPGSSLNPVLCVGTQLRETGVTPSEAGALLRQVALPESVLKRYPHELSGGMQQRAMIAMAIASRPALLIADEPTTALDVTTQQEILSLLDTLRKERAMGVLLITHNLGLVARFAQAAYVMYAGQTVESGDVPALLSHPRHPYTRGLLRAVPRLGMTSIDELHGIPGRVPSPTQWPPGCGFAPRCPDASAQCTTTAPTFEEGVRCHHWKMKNEEVKMKNGERRMKNEKCDSNSSFFILHSSFPKPPRHIIWDWNGTLQDDVEAAVNGINALLLPRNLPLCTLERHRRLFQFPVRKYYEAVGFELEKENWQALAVRFHEVFTNDPTIRLKPEARTVLQTFKEAGIGQSLLSACEQGILDRLVAHYGIRDYFGVVSGLDNLSAQSKLENGRRLVEGLGLPPEEVWFIGDTDHDYELAHAFGASCLLLTDGYQDDARLAHCPCPKIHSLGAVLDFFHFQGETCP